MEKEIEISKENNNVENNNVEKNNSFLRYYSVFTILKAFIFGGFLIIGGIHLDKISNGESTAIGQLYLNIIKQSDKISYLEKYINGFLGTLFSLTGAIILFQELNSFIRLSSRIKKKSYKKASLSLIHSITLDLLYVLFFAVLIYYKTDSDTNQLTLNCISLIIVCAAHILSNLFLFRELIVKSRLKDNNELIEETK